MSGCGIGRSLLATAACSCARSLRTTAACRRSASRDWPAARSRCGRTLATTAVAAISGCTASPAPCGACVAGAGTTGASTAGTGDAASCTGGDADGASISGWRAINATTASDAAIAAPPPQRSHVGMRLPPDRIAGASSPRRAAPTRKAKSAGRRCAGARPRIVSPARRHRSQLSASGASCCRRRNRKRVWSGGSAPSISADNCSRLLSWVRSLVADSVFMSCAFMRASASAGRHGRAAVSCARRSPRGRGRCANAPCRSGSPCVRRSLRSSSLPLRGR